MSSTDELKDIERFLKENPAVLELLKDPEKRKALDFLCREGFDQIDYLIKNPWIDLQKIERITDGIMDISPEISDDELLNILCRDTAVITNAKGATCRTYDPIKNSMIAAGAYNWDVERTEEIPPEDSLAGRVIKTRTHYCVPDIRNEAMYKEKEKILSMGINSMLAVPIQLIDYEGTEKKDVLIGTLQLYFEEKNKEFFPPQIRLVKSIVSRFSYVLAQKRKLELQKRSLILRESRKALISVLKQTQSLDQVLNFLVAKIAETINVNRCSLFSLEDDPGGNKFAVLIAGYPLAPFAHGYGITLPFEEHPAFEEVCETGQPLLIEDARKDPRMKASLGLYLHEKIENVYFTPIKDENDVVTNVLVLDGDESRPLEKDDMFFCNALIQDIELCIQASIRVQQRHDFLNQMVSFGAIAKVYTKKLASPDTTAEDLNILYKKLYKSMLAVNDIITDRVPFAQKEQFNLNEVISERLEAYHFPPQVSIEKNIFDGEIFITADKKKVGRIVGNLLDNAYKKFEELKRGVLKVFSYTEDNYAVIEIGNTGSVPPEIQENIMQDYRPISRHGMEESSLGLSIVKLFTVMHNGILEFESPPEKNWTVFRVKLPR